MGRLVRADYMQLIYSYCIRVYRYEITVNKACSELIGKTESTKASLKMYFRIYACMRQGICYKRGTSAAFTRFLIQHIYKDNGENAFLLALAAAKQNADYRIGRDNEQPGIEAVCRELIAESKLPITYESLFLYYGNSGVSSARKAPKENTDYVLSVDYSDEQISVSVFWSDISFQVKGNPKTVVTKFKSFSEEILPQIIVSVNGTMSNSTKNTSDGCLLNRKGEKSNNSGIVQKSVGQQLVEMKLVPEALKSKKDFKARMIPLLFFADEFNLQKDFSIQEIQTIMKDAIGEEAQKKDIEDVFFRRSHWFEKTNNNPRRYKLLDTAKDYAKNIIA